jgi:hypothetical protein
MSKLNPLRSRLFALARRRWLLRLLTGYSGLALAVLWVLLAAFAVDWCLELSRPYRVGTLAVIAGVVLWGFARYVRPMLGLRESLIDMALFVEGQHHIDSDFVAALEFESPQAAQWGSPQLEDAVIDDVAAASPRVNVFRGLDYRSLRRRAGTLAVMAGLIAGAVALWPDHAAAFLNRLLLGSAHYPTRTRIDELTVNGQKLDLTPGKLSIVKVPYGAGLEIAAVCSGVLPDAGRADLWDLDGPHRGELDLLPEDSQGPTDALHRRYTGRMAKLLNSIGFQLYLGDAWTDPTRVLVVPLPSIDVQLKVTPPAYTSGGDSLESPAGARQISVIEGSRVDVVLHSNKGLAQAKLTIKKQDYALERDGSRSSTEKEAWVTAGDTPLGQVVEPVYYTIQVVDSDGLSLEKPIEGYIRIRPDNPPKAFADVRTRTVLKNAVANIFYGASDEYGLAELNVKVRVLRASKEGGKEKEEAAAKKLSVPLSGRPRRVSSLLFQLDRELENALNQPQLAPPLREAFARHEVRLSPEARISFARRGGGRWLLADPAEKLNFEIRSESSHLNVYRVFPLDLSAFDLAVGDQVRLELEAVDYRGDMPGKAAVSEAIVLNVTDETGFLAASTETDQRSADQLDAIIRLGLGETP